MWDYHELGHAIESCAPTVFYFPTRKFLMILFEFLDFLRSLDRFKILIRVIISDFYMAWKKNPSKIFTYRRGGRLLTLWPDSVDISYIQINKEAKELRRKFSKSRYFKLHYEDLKVITQLGSALRWTRAGKFLLNRKVFLNQPPTRLARPSQKYKME